MSKKKIIIIVSIIVGALIVAGLYGTFATSSTVSGSDNTYAITLSGATGEVLVPAGTSKTVIYQITNTNKGIVQYGIAYSGNNITVKVYGDSQDSHNSTIGYGENKFIKLYIENTSSEDSTAYLKTILGYEYGGSLDSLVPSGHTFVTESYTKPSGGSGGSSGGNTLIDFITNLYFNANKTEVTNNGITYNYATSVSLMNDRLGGTTDGYDSGNIRYYGANPNNYIDIGDVYTEDTVIDNFEKNSLGLSLLNLGITDSKSCYSTLDCSVNYSNLGFGDAATCETALENQFGITNVDDVCGTTTKKAGDPKLYRVIGLFKDIEKTDGTTQDLVKVIREDSIGNLAWDLKVINDSDINCYNNWHNATLQTILNGAYYNAGSTSHSYYDLLSADFVLGNTIDFKKSGLNSTVHDKIETVVWNLGGWNTNDIYSNQVYEYERGDSKCADCTYETTWPGKIALAYPSDVGYAVDFTICSDSLSNYVNCIASDWMVSFFNGNGVEWLLTPNSGNSYFAWGVYFGNFDSSSVVSDGIGVRPVFYLDSELVIESGDGSKSTPFVVR